MIDTSGNGGTPVSWYAESSSWDPAVSGRCCPAGNVGPDCLEGTELWDITNNKVALHH